MSGLEALGATASVLQLAELCAKCSRKTAQIVRSYRDAPKEIKQLAMKVEMLKFHIEQVQQIAGDLSDIDLDDLLPEIHREVLTEQLQLHYEFLQGIRSVAAGDDAPSRGSKLQWALIDKKKTNHIMEDVASTQQILDQILNIVSVRLATVQQSSLAALRISHAALLPALEVHMQEIKATIGTAPGRGFVRWEDTRTEFVRRDSNGPPASEYRHVEDTELTRPGHRLGSRTPKYFAATDHESRAGPRLESEYSDVDFLLSLTQVGANQPVRYSKWNFTDNQSRDTVPTKRKPRYEAQFSVKLSQYSRDFRASFKFRFFLLNERILRFELGLQQFTHAWTSVSLSDFRIRVTNLIPSDSLIFKLCKRGDLDGVKHMLENGRGSICDVDENGAGLLDHAISDLGPLAVTHGQRLERAKLHRYLIQQGCVPLAHDFWVAGNGVAVPPAIFAAFSRGYTDTARLMLRSSSTFDLFATYSPTTYICHISKSDYREQLSLFASLGLIEKGAADGSLLAPAVSIGSIPDIIHAKEILRVDADFERVFRAVSYNENAKLASVIQEYASTPKWANELSGGSITHLAHWFLFDDEDRTAASTGFYQRYSRAGPTRILVADCLWGAVCGEFLFYSRYNWHFQTIVTRLQHLLLHKESANPQRWDECDTNFFTQKTIIATAQDIAQAWDRNLRVEEEDFPGTTDHSWKGSVWWDLDGNIYPVYWELGSDEEFDGEEMMDSSEESVDVEPSEHPTTQTASTLFESIISTAEGRRQMTRYPLTTALYYALHLAGFLVEMDDDGEIWYDDDDCDRYSDAVEDQEDYNKPGPLGGTCKICRDPEGYGLGHILEEAEEGLVEWRYERQKFVDRGALEPDGWEWPSWTRRGGRI